MCRLVNKVSTSSYVFSLVIDILLLTGIVGGFVLMTWRPPRKQGTHSDRLPRLECQSSTTMRKTTVSRAMWSSLFLDDILPNIETHFHWVFVNAKVFCYLSNNIVYITPLLRNLSAAISQWKVFKLQYEIAHVVAVTVGLWKEVWRWPRDLEARHVEADQVKKPRYVLYRQVLIEDCNTAGLT